MTFDNRLAELLDAATVPVPPGRLAAPLPAIRRRIRRQRMVTAAAVTGVVASLVVGALVARPTTDRTAPPATTTTTAHTPADLRLRVPWESALVARDGRSVTVYAGPRGGCQELINGTAVVTGQDGGQVTIAARAWIVPTNACGPVVPIQVRLSDPLGDREVRDAATGEARPTYRESHLPDLTNDRRWWPLPLSWAAPDDRWAAAYEDRRGLTLRIDAEPGSTAGGRPEDAVQMGSRAGTLFDLKYAWAVRWAVGDVTYELSVSRESHPQLTREEFVAELARLAWP